MRQFLYVQHVLKYVNCQLVFILVFIGLLAYFMYGASEHR